jgi:hypothetical protein
MDGSSKSSWGTMGGKIPIGNVGITTFRSKIQSQESDFLGFRGLDHSRTLSACDMLTS